MRDKGRKGMECHGLGLSSPNFKRKKFACAFEWTIKLRVGWSFFYFLCPSWLTNPAHHRFNPGESGF